MLSSLLMALSVPSIFLALVITILYQQNHFFFSFIHLEFQLFFFSLSLLIPWVSAIDTQTLKPRR